MSQFNFKNASFVTTALKMEGYPLLVDARGKPFREIAVAGRSNVGKSSLLNHLFQRKALVKTSSVPGKTQAVNFFKVDNALSVVDLPGYGYAKVPHNVRREWGPMVQDYLSNRKELELVLFLFDIRRIPNEDDFQMMNWLIHSKKAVIFVFTKIDKVKVNEKKANTQKILKAFNLENLYYVHYSSTKNQGRQELIKIISDAFSEE